VFCVSPLTVPGLGGIEHVQPEQRLAIRRQRLAGVDDAQALALAGVHAEQRRRDQERHARGIGGGIGIAGVDPGFDQGWLLAVVVQAHGDFATGGREHHAGAADHDAGVGRATEGRQGNQHGAKGEQVLHRRIPGTVER